MDELLAVPGPRIAAHAVADTSTFLARKNFAIAIIGGSVGDQARRIWAAPVRDPDAVAAVIGTHPAGHLDDHRLPGQRMCGEAWLLASIRSEIFAIVDTDGFAQFGKQERLLCACQLDRR